jgi:hypothetical protein
MKKKVTSSLEHQILEALHRIMIIINVIGSEYAGYRAINERHIWT